MRKPRIKLSHQILLTADNQVCLGEAGPNMFVVKQPPAFFLELVKLLNGQHSQAAIVNNIIAKFPEISRQDIDSLIKQMQARHLLEDADEASTLLSPEEMERYDRQMLYFSLVEQANQRGFHYQEQLKNKKIAIFGLGSWGTWLALNLALTGIGELILIDGDTVSLSNLNRQVLYGTTDVDKPKVLAAQANLKKINPHLKVNAKYLQVKPDLALINECIHTVDFIFLAWTSYAYFIENTIEALIHKQALAQQIPIMEASADPLSIYIGPLYRNHPGDVTFFDLKDKIKADWYGNSGETATIKKASIQSQLLDPTRKLDAWQYAPSLSAMAGLAVSEALKYLGGYATPTLINKQFRLDLDTFISAIKNW